MYVHKDKEMFSKFSLQILKNKKKIKILFRYSRKALQLAKVRQQYFLINLENVKDVTKRILR